jgi:hypothetical protein
VNNLILIPFNGAWLALTPEQLQEALAQGQALLGARATATAATAEEKVLDAEGMEHVTGIPASWYLEAARQGRIPHIRAGKYVRYRLSEVLDALAAGLRPGDKLSPHMKMRALDQLLAKGSNRGATKTRLESGARTE